MFLTIRDLQIKCLLKNCKKIKLEISKGDNMAALINEKLGLEKININARNHIADKIGMSEAQLAKIEQLSKAGVVVGSSLHQDFSINIVNGSGSFGYSKNTWWVTINVSGKINAPPEGTWRITVKDGGTVIFDKAGIRQGELISFSYGTGFSVDLTMTAIWSELANTTLTGYLDISY